MTLSVGWFGTTNARTNLRSLFVTKTILVVEDNRFLRATTERSLVRAGYKVVTACDGDEALRMAAETGPDLVLLDMLLPKLSGPEVLRSLRTIPQTEAVPIVVLGSPPQSNERKLKRDDATAYSDKSSLALHKHSDSLLQIMKQMLNEPGEDSSRIDVPDSQPPVAAKGKL
jgi:CheY-like chemotaxis protein